MRGGELGVRPILGAGVAMDKSVLQADSSELMRLIARELGCSELTPLQEQALNTKGFVEDEDLFIVGETSSGKTLLPELLYFCEVIRACRRERKMPRMLFVVPYRALAAQKSREFHTHIEKVCDGFGLGVYLTCVQSTGEFRDRDQDVKLGDVDIAVVINEKAYRFASEDSRFFGKFDLVVLDEVGLVDNDERGIRIDFMLAWAMRERRRCGRPRTVVLGTPYYDWKRYVESYGFAVVSSQCRPVPIEEHVVYYRKYNDYFDMTLADAENPCLIRARGLYPKFFENKDTSDPTLTAPCVERDGQECPVMTPCRSNLKLACVHTGRRCSSPLMRVEKDVRPIDCLIETICRHHLEANHQIIIFKNSRSELPSLVRALWEGLGEELVRLRPEERSIAYDVKSAREIVLDECGLDAEDLYGVMEDEPGRAEGGLGHGDLYQALVAGIGFHSASVPVELRSYIEEHLLENRDLSIVCATETLAYGVNSSVDVVIVADINKPNRPGGTRPLSANEYRNYIGRCGRLRPAHLDDKDHAGTAKGYAYTLLNCKRKIRSEASSEMAGMPLQKVLFERLRRELERPSMLCSGLFRGCENRLPFYLLNLVPPPGESITPKEILGMVDGLPMPDEVRGSRERQGAFRQLVADSLRFLEEERLIVRESADARRSMRRSARIRRREAYRYVLTNYGEAMRGYIMSVDDYRLVRAALESSFYPELSMFDNEILLAEVVKSRRVKLGGGRRGRMGDVDAGSPCTDDERKLAAILDWTRCRPPGLMYENYGVHTTLVADAAEAASYLVEIASRMIASVVERHEKEWLVDDGLIERSERQLGRLRLSLQYGVDLDVRDRLLDFLRNDGESRRSAVLMERFGGLLKPTEARELRRIAIRYNFLRESSAESPTPSAGDGDGGFQRRRQYVRDVRGMEEPIRRFFESELPDALLPGRRHERTVG